jgi:hypothetical protein
MKSKKVSSNFKVVIVVIGLFFISIGSKGNMPVYALGPFLRINVTPSNISFNIFDAEIPKEYYSANQEITVVSRNTFPLPWTLLPWYLGIRSGEAYLKDSINPDNRISVSQLRWSKDGQHYQPLSQEWVLVSTYFDYLEKSYEERISYRLYSEPGQSLPAGIYSLRIEFDARWLNLPWR